MLEIIKEVIGKALYEKRMEFGLSQEAMSVKCCISNRQYSDLENGKRLPSLRTFINIAIVCDLDVNKLIRQIVAAGYLAVERKDKA